MIIYSNLQTLDKELTHKDNLVTFKEKKNNQSTFFGHAMRRGQLEYVVATGKIEKEARDDKERRWTVTYGTEKHQYKK